MRRIIALLLLLFLFAPSAQAEFIQCQRCSEMHEIAYLQKGDVGIGVEGLCKALIKNGYLPADSPLQIFNDSVFAALKSFQHDNGLPETGMGDDETLSRLLYGMSREDCKSHFAELPDHFFWVPTDGGKRVHEDACCSYMIEPRAISLFNALAMQIEPCGVCARQLRCHINWQD